MNRVQWGIWTDTPAEENSRRVVAAVLTRLGAESADLTMTAYPKTGGHRIYFSTPSRGDTWAEQVLHAVQSGFRVGRAWTLTGDGENELSGWSNEPSANGAVSISWDLVRRATV